MPPCLWSSAGNEWNERRNRERVVARGWANDLRTPTKSAIKEEEWSPHSNCWRVSAQRGDLRCRTGAVPYVAL